MTIFIPPNYDFTTSTVSALNLWLLASTETPLVT